MYLTVNNKKYETISNISFAPQVDVTGQSLPINDFYVDAQTEDNIAISQWALLYDDLNHLYAKYWIKSVERTSLEVATIHAQSILAKLENKISAARMYENEPVIDIISRGFDNDPSLFYLDDFFLHATVSGYFPRQTRKERLQSICFAIGAYVKTFFTDKVEIKPIDPTERNVLPERTYWRPSLTHTDYIKSITVTYFSFEHRQPQSGEEYVKAQGEYYVVTRNEFVLNNPNIPQGTTSTDEIHVDDVYIINANNVSDVASRLATIYFQNQQVDAEIVNNGDIFPADNVSLMIDPPDEEGRMAVGYVDSCDYSFGLQSKSRIHMIVSEIRQTTKLIINYMFGNTRLGRKKYNLPIGTSYSIENPYIDQTSGRDRYVYYPKNQNATGTIVEGTNTNNQPYDVALHWYGNTRILEILSVSEIRKEDEVVIIE